MVWIRPGLRILPNDYVMAANRQAVASSLAAGATARKKKGAFAPFLLSLPNEWYLLQVLWFDGMNGGD